jgi:hypothetical protein
MSTISFYHKKLYQVSKNWTAKTATHSHPRQSFLHIPEADTGSPYFRVNSVHPYSGGKKYML